MTHYITIWIQRIQSTILIDTSVKTTICLSLLSDSTPPFFPPLHPLPTLPPFPYPSLSSPSLPSPPFHPFSRPGLLLHLLPWPRPSLAAQSGSSRGPMASASFGLLACLGFLKPQ